MPNFSIFGGSPNPTKLFYFRKGPPSLQNFWIFLEAAPDSAKLSYFWRQPSILTTLLNLLEITPHFAKLLYYFAGRPDFAKLFYFWRGLPTLPNFSIFGGSPQFCKAFLILEAAPNLPKTSLFSKAFIFLEAAPNFPKRFSFLATIPNVPNHFLFETNPDFTNPFPCSPQLPARTPLTPPQGRTGHLSLLTTLFFFHGENPLKDAKPPEIAGETIPAVFSNSFGNRSSSKTGTATRKRLFKSQLNHRLSSFPTVGVFRSSQSPFSFAFRRDGAGMRFSSCRWGGSGRDRAGKLSRNLRSVDPKA